MLLPEQSLCSTSKKKGMVMGWATNNKQCGLSSHLPTTHHTPSLGSLAGDVFSWWVCFILIKTLVEELPGSQPALTSEAVKSVGSQ